MTEIVSSQRTLNIGLLLCDTPPDSVREAHGDYASMFTNLLSSVCSKWFPQVSLKISTFDVVQGIFPTQSEISHFDAFLMTGSKYGAYENDPWIKQLLAFVQLIDKKYDSVKLIGICFGHQIIAQALGGKVEPNPLGWEVGWTEITLNDLGKELLSDATLFPPNVFRIQEMHKDIVTQTPPGFEILASTSVTTNQVMIKRCRFLSIQAHPEYNGEIVSKIIQMRREKGIFSNEDAANWLNIVHQPLDSEWFTRMIIKFLIE